VNGGGAGTSGRLGIWIVRRGPFPFALPLAEDEGEAVDVGTTGWVCGGEPGEECRGELHGAGVSGRLGVSASTVGEAIMISSSFATSFGCTVLATRLSAATEGAAVTRAGTRIISRISASPSLAAPINASIA